ncbi:hypothetical protein HanRHA438_Chr17g0802821 [Helianthus annuus]|nr:hypothetical protein HanRHA438_Chr17g0802821 [Helianthus annuus]
MLNIRLVLNAFNKDFLCVLEFFRIFGMFVMSQNVALIFLECFRILLQFFWNIIVISLYFFHKKWFY